MNLRQLQYLCEIVDQNLNVSKTASVLHTSQPGISKQIKLLEEELGIDILVRRSNRIVAVTEQGLAVVEIARRMLRDANNIRLVGKEYGGGEAGTLSVATTHAHGRYLLLPAVNCFREKYPSITFKILQATPDQIVKMVSTGQVDMAVATQFNSPPDDVVELPFFTMQRCIITPPDHPLLHKKNITLKDIVPHPMITLDSSFLGGSTTLDVFHAAGLEPNVVLSATDADVIKAYVESGLGISTLPKMAFNPVRDTGLRAIPAEHLFKSLMSCVSIHRHSYLRNVVAEFIQMLSAKWTREAIEAVMDSKLDPFENYAEEDYIQDPPAVPLALNEPSNPK